jgi:hypothetical protein
MSVTPYAATSKADEEKWHAVMGKRPNWLSTIGLTPRNLQKSSHCQELRGLLYSYTTITSPAAAADTSLQEDARLF